MQIVKLLSTTTVAKVEARRENFFHVNIVVEKVIYNSSSKEGMIQNTINIIS